MIYKLFTIKSDKNVPLETILVFGDIKIEKIEKLKYNLRYGKYEEEIFIGGLKESKEVKYHDTK